MNKIKFPTCSFLTSAAQLRQLPADTGWEVAFAGRSNAGKSSAINVITGQKNLARTSKTPGRTQLINFFSLTVEKFLVDLPGYGYAKVSHDIKERWQNTLARYLETRISLKGLILVSDIRHPLKEYDQHMLTWATQRELPIHILLTKTDKLSRGAAQQTLLQVEKNAHAFSTHVSVQLFSAHTKLGVDIARQQILNWLEL